MHYKQSAQLSKFKSKIFSVHGYLLPFLQGFWIKEDDLA